MKAEGARVNSQARVQEQMLQLHFEVGVEEKSMLQVKVMRAQWQEPLYSFGAMVGAGVVVVVVAVGLLVSVAWRCFCVVC